MTMTTSAPIDYNYLRSLVFSQSQNVLDPSRDHLFETRLSNLLRNEGLKHLDEFVQQLRTKKDPLLERAVAEAMTINETSFFRDGHPFDLLRTDLLSPIIESRRTARSLRIWSGACSTGQEAHSLAMLIKEYFPHLSGWQIQIEGTDISSEVVHRAQSGIYHRIEINRGLPARFIVRYFDHIGEDWIIKDEIKQMCTYRIANICAPSLPFSEKFDLIFLRNVMLYFSMDTRKALLTNIHRLLAPDGILFLGSSEQPADPTIWESILAGGTCYFTPK